VLLTPAGPLGDIAHGESSYLQYKRVLTILAAGKHPRAKNR